MSMRIRMIASHSLCENERHLSDSSSHWRSIHVEQVACPVGRTDRGAARETAVACKRDRIRGGDDADHANMTIIIAVVIIIAGADAKAGAINAVADGADGGSRRDGVACLTSGGVRACEYFFMFPLFF